MATAQKRGFRFPWGGDSRHEEHEAPDAPSLAERLGAGADELGRGPFDLPESPSGPDADSEATVDSAAQADQEAAGGLTARSEAAVAPATQPRLVMRAPNAEPMVIATPAPIVPEPEPAVAEPDDEPAALAPEPGPMALDPEPMAVAPEPRAAAPDAEPDVAEPAAQRGWPDADRRSSGGVAPRPKATPSTATAEARRSNPLVAGLVRAMREAARTAHDDAVATLRVDVAARTEAIREYGTAKAAELKKAADADVLSIREWSKAEMARVREETESKIAARRIQLVAETERESRDTDALLARLTAAIEAFEAETEAFFKTLLAEEDPGRLAGLAEQLPPPPSLDEFPAGAGAGVDASRSRAVRSQPVTPRSSASAAMAERDAQVATDDGVPVASGPDGPSQTVPPEAEAPADALDAAAAAAAEAEALIGLDEKTQLIVSGLTNVGSIAAFKAAILASPGVNAVSVNAGEEGDVLITISHAADADMRHAVRAIEAFQPAVIADDGTTLVIVAREPAA